MHDFVFIESLIKNVKDSDNVKEIFLEVGELSGFEAEHLKEHLEEISKWKVSVEQKNSKVKCTCGFKGRAKIDQRLHDFVIYSCPKCGKVPGVIEGKEIRIVRIVYN